MFKKIKFTKIKNYFIKLPKNRVFKKVLIAFGATIVFLALFFVGFNIAFNEKVLPHTFIGSTDFGGYKKSQALDKLKEMQAQSQNGQLAFDWENNSYNLNFSELNVNWASKDQETIKSLFDVGRSGSISQVLGDQIRAMFSKNKTYASFDYDAEKLNVYLQGIAQNIDKPEKDASIVFKNDVPEVQAEEIGQKFPIDENKDIALNTIGSFATSQTIFIVKRIEPKVNSFGAQMALAETQILLGRNLVLTNKDKKYEIGKKDITNFLTFAVVFGKKGVLGVNNSSNSDPKGLTVMYSLAPELSNDKVKEFVEKIATEINQPAKDAKFEVTGGRVVAFQTAQTGYEVDKEKAVQDIIEALKSGNQTIELPIKVTQPAISDDVSANSFTELVGEGRTSWRGSPSNRIHNLSLGASKISGTVVKPGEEFSTVKTIGVIGPSTGFLQELVIKNSTRVEPEYGGGLCQVSTTLFRAVLNSGLKITARTPHSFRVSYYEPPVGMDATIYDPAPDFKFINDYKTPILIWAIPGSNTLDFQIYGTKDGRKIEISNPVTYNYVPAGGAIYTETPTMASGAIRQVERATSGCSASFTYKVTASNGTILENETFVSKYVAIPNSYLYGPGTTGIPGQAPPPQVSTPAPTPTPVKIK